jgi:putative methyltransferase (TIGR04325 family)
MAPVSRLLAPLKRRLPSIFELLPAGRDLYLMLARKRIGISYRGLFSSRAAAQAAIPGDTAKEYDVINKGKARHEAEEKQRLETWFHLEDYALLFWLSRLLDQRSAVLELGGSVGHFFYSIQRHGICGREIRWTIAELPEAVKLGAAIAQERDERRLAFIDSSRLADVEPADIFVTAGTLQYMEAPLWTILSGLTQRPTHVLVHNLPVHEHRGYWTLQQLPVCEVPYRVYSHAELVDQMTSLGYRQVDTWKKPRDIEIPFHRETKVEGYLGFCFSSQP